MLEEGSNSEIEKVEKILSPFGFRWEEAEKWGKEAFPTLMGNKIFLAKLFLSVAKGIKITPGGLVKIKDLVEEDRCTIDVVVAQKGEENSYTGCPNCMKKLHSGQCPDHGMVPPVERFWKNFLVGDDSGEIIARLPPSIEDELRIGSRVKLFGVLASKDKIFAIKRVHSDGDVKSVIPASASVPASVSRVAASTTMSAPQSLTVSVGKVEVMDDQALTKYLNIAYLTNLAKEQWEVEVSSKYKGDLNAAIAKLGYKIEERAEGDVKKHYLVK